MSDQTAEEARELLPEEKQQLRTKFRIEREFATEHGCPPDASRDEIRETIMDCTPPQRLELRRRKQVAYDRLRTLMEP